MASNLMLTGRGYLLPGRTGVSMGGWQASADYRGGQRGVQHRGFAPIADMTKQVVRPTIIDVPTGTPPSARRRRP